MIKARTLMRLIQLDNASIIDDLRLPPSNHLEELLGEYHGVSQLDRKIPYILLSRTRGS